MLFLSAFVLFAIAWISTRVSNQIRPIRVYLFRAHEEEIESEPELVDSVSQSPISQENEPHDNEDEVVFTESENSEANEDEDELRDYLTTRKQCN
ncbi:unnamed protein product [Protopolystoma xenopodis]|uniref:Uncharacterized protein n=1 Tax=Protopolystoma xenopodis TaxID=117903 RepID=A0A448XSX4_9PLAT|nr:unnamed protein product [Protopolystoma xenopodis]